MVSAPIIEESPLCIECRVKEIISLGSHDMFIADVVNVKADDKYLNKETGKFELAGSNPLVYVHGGYFDLGTKIGKFGWSVEKRKRIDEEKFPAHIGIVSFHVCPESRRTEAELPNRA